MNDWQLLDGIEYLQIYLACLIMFLLMYVPFSLYGKYAYFHSLVGVASGQENTITIKGEGKEQIKLNPDDILYAQSDDNYIDLILADAEVPGRKIVFRCTLKSLADQLKDHPQFLRIHRSIITNIRYIVLGEEWPLKSAEVSFKNFSITLPISKSYLAEVERVLVRPK
ncbi:MAG: LytTR family DNA-binding domain-containing protein [Cyclobacteriaceae bacterium]